jgi:1-acyl-sn-glycerol-3-phosphate acyltransferase
LNPQLNLARAVSYTMLMSQRAMIEKAFGAPNERVRELCKQWAVGLANRAGVEVTTHGFDRTDWSRTFVVMANHQSYLDVLALFWSLPRPFGVLAKKSLYRIPFFSGVMEAIGCVPVDRADRNDAVSSIRDAADRVRSGTSISVFPEGTRSPGDRVTKLKKGAFYLVQEAQVPILPIGIVGTGALMPRSNRALYPGHIDVFCGEPIAPPPPKDNKARSKTMAEVRTALSQLTGLPEQE